MAIVRSQLSVPYSKVQASTYRTSTGELVYEDIDTVYRKYDVREKVIIRVDIMDKLTEGILSKNADIILKKNYLSVLFGLIDNVDMISEILKDIYIRDEQFKLFLGNICYFELPKVSNVSLFQYLVADNKVRRIRIQEDFGNRSSLSSTGVFITSLWYLYVGINDKTDAVCIIPEDFKVEAVSYAKKWDCKYPRAL